MTTTTQIQGAIKVVAAIAETIRELGSIPSGHLYAQLMGRMTIEQYNGVIDTLKNAGLVREESHLLIWDLKPEARV